MTQRAHLWRQRLLQAIMPLVGVAAGLAIGLLFVVIAGESPWHVLTILFKSAFGSLDDLGLTLFYTTPLIFTGLSVGVAYQIGLFNIGAEGQLAMGAVAATAVGIFFPEVAPFIAWSLSILAAATAGGIWGFIPGWLKVKRGSHEVVTTIMLNFIAAAAVSWLTLNWLKDSASQNPETLMVGASYRLSQLHFFGETPVNTALYLALGLCFIMYVVLNRTVWGYELHVTGKSERAARFAGIHTNRYAMRTMFAAGALAGLAGLSDVLGSAGRLKLGFSNDYGFTGIAVALLARGKPIPTIFGALLFGALQKGALDLDIETDHITRDLSHLLQACVLIAIAADGVWNALQKRLSGRHS